MKKILLSFILSLLVISCSNRAKKTELVDRNAVRLIIKDNIKKFKTCYTNELKKKTLKKNYSFKTSLIWYINDTGKAYDAKMQKKSPKKTMDSCLISTMESLEFPKAPANSKVKVIYPFVFSGSSTYKGK